MKNQLQKATSLPVFRKFYFRYFYLLALLVSCSIIFSSCQKEEVIIVGMPDKVFPSVISTDPANGETDVQLDKRMAVTFDQQLDTSRFMVSITLQKDIMTAPVT